jgi:hypothetical protein
MAAGVEDRALGGVGLRRQRQVDRGLGEREVALGQPDVLDRRRGATAISSACGSALPTSSDAKTIIRRTM